MMIQPKSFLNKLYEHLSILKEREVKYAGEAPLALLNQIEDHKQAISLTQQVMAGEITETEWLQALQPLLLASHHWSGLSLAALLVLSRYAQDQEVELNRQVGPTAAATAGDIFSLVLDRVKAVDPRTARKYPDNPEGYQTPLADALAEVLQADPDFALKLKDLLRQYDQALAVSDSDHTIQTGKGLLVQGQGAVGIQQGDQGQVIIGSQIKGDVLGPGASKRDDE